MDVEEIYDKIGSTYNYTYQEFLDQVTPKLADKLIRVIHVRENNDACYNAILGMMQPKDIQKRVIKPKMKSEFVEAAEVSAEQREATKNYLANLAKRGNHG